MTPDPTAKTRAWQTRLRQPINCPKNNGRDEERRSAAGTTHAGKAAPRLPLSRRAIRFHRLVLADALAGRHRYHRNGGPVLLIDATTRQYHGPALLKPMRGYFDGNVRARISSRSTQRLGKGKCCPGEPHRCRACSGTRIAVRQGRAVAGPGARRPLPLSKWPQTEREFPKHFRIATAMMKGPATLDEVAAASGVPLAEVADFVNASLVTGYAEVVPEPPTEPAEPPKPAGLFGRLRGR